MKIIDKKIIYDENFLATKSKNNTLRINIPSTFVALKRFCTLLSTNFFSILGRIIFTFLTVKKLAYKYLTK